MSNVTHGHNERTESEGILKHFYLASFFLSPSFSPSLSLPLFSLPLSLSLSSFPSSLSIQFSEPNSVFIFEELLKSSSFPRKTLDSVGPSALSKWHLRVTDSMLRGVWSKFILTIFTQMEDYQVTYILSFIDIMQMYFFNVQLITTSFSLSLSLLPLSFSPPSLFLSSLSLSLLFPA